MTKKVHPYGGGPYRNPSEGSTLVPCRSLRALAFLRFRFLFFCLAPFFFSKKNHFFTIKRDDEPHDPRKKKDECSGAHELRSFLPFLLIFTWPGSGVFLRPEWTAIAHARILKILGESKSLALRLVSKKTRDTIDSLYSMAFPSVAPRIFVRCPGITSARVTRVRSILTGQNGTSGPNGRHGPNGTKNATIVLACDATAPCADETYSIREFPGGAP